MKVMNGIRNRRRNMISAMMFIFARSNRKIITRDASDDEGAGVGHEPERGCRLE